MAIFDKELTEMGNQKQYLQKKIEKNPNDAGLVNQLNNLEEKIRKRRLKIVEDNSPKQIIEVEKVIDLDGEKETVEVVTNEKYVTKNENKEKIKELKERYKLLVEEYKIMCSKIVENRNMKEQLKKEIMELKK